MKGILLRLAVIMLGAVFIFTGGCARSKPAKFYTLSAIDISSIASRSETTDSDVALGIGPINLPDYLDRPQIATRNSRNALAFAEFNRWAGSLKEGFSRILAENLALLLATDRIVLFPWKSTTPIDYRITANVIRFEGHTAGDVTLKARWSVLDSSGETVLAMKLSRFTEPVGGGNYEALVAAQSRALEGLSREIAEAIHTIMQETCD